MFRRVLYTNGYIMQTMVLVCDRGNVHSVQVRRLKLERKTILDGALYQIIWQTTYVSVAVSLETRNPRFLQKIGH